MTEPYAELLKRAQAVKLDALRKRTADKIPHHEYLLDLIRVHAAGKDYVRDVHPPETVSNAAMMAIVADFDWIAQPVPEEGCTVPDYPNDYEEYRAHYERAAARKRMYERARG